jgi:hypothetical protein
MQLANAPSKIVLPFAADDATKNVIPVPSQQGTTPGAASYTDGFPPLTAVDPTEGGVGPSKADFNGILNAVSAIDLWLNAGASFPYDATFQTAIGGYPQGARVLMAAGGGFWLSIVDNNMTDPDTGGAGWIPQGSQKTSSVFASTQQTLAVGDAKVLFDTVEFDSGFWNAANKRFTALYAGKYRITAAVTLIGPGSQLLATQVFKNGAVAKQSYAAPQVSDQNLTLPFEAIINCAVGDFIEIYVVVGSTSVLAGVVGSNEALVFAQLEYLGT